MVPTYNRRDLLVETLAGVDQQTRPLDAVIVVDNASTDATAEAVAAHFPGVEIDVLPENCGSAGGFGRGLLAAFRRGHEWIWLLDNDSVPAPDALAELCAALERFPTEERPKLLASKVLWTDGTVLPLNVPLFKRKNVSLLYRAAEFGTLSLRAAPYAGVMVHRSLVEEYGVPIEGYFLWNDDLEWTGRLLRDQLGVLVPKSVVVHKTPGNPTTTADAGPRFVFELRNKLWMLRTSDAYRPMEKARFAGTLAVDTIRYLVRTHPRRSATAVVVRGLVSGLVRTPPAPAPPPSDR